MIREEYKVAPEVPIFEEFGVLYHVHFYTSCCLSYDVHGQS